MFHWLFPRRCLASFYIDECGNIICTKCGRSMGFVYCAGQRNTIFIYRRWKKYKQQIVELVQQTDYEDEIVEDREWAQLKHSIPPYECIILDSDSVDEVDLDETCGCNLEECGFEE